MVFDSVNVNEMISAINSPGATRGFWRAKIVADCSGYLSGSRDTGLVLLDSLSLSRHGESSSELGSVMILDPAFGNSLWKVTVCRTVKHHMSNKLFVGNLSFNTTENDLQDAFAHVRHGHGNQPDDGSHDQPPPRLWFRDHEQRRRSPEGHRRHERQGHGRSRLDCQCCPPARRASGGGGGGRREFGGGGGGGRRERY